MVKVVTDVTYTIDVDVETFLYEFIQMKSF